MQTWIEWALDELKVYAHDNLLAAKQDLGWRLDVWRLEMGMAVAVPVEEPVLPTDRFLPLFDGTFVYVRDVAGVTA